MNKIRTPIQIRFADVDRLGHVNNAFYLSYLELARIDFFSQVAGAIDWDAEGVILARVELDYLVPALLEDRLFVDTWCSRTGGKSFDLSYEVVRTSETGEETVAQALSVMVCYDYRIHKSIPMPESWKAWLNG